jgi:outer membrane protein
MMKTIVKAGLVTVMLISFAFAAQAQKFGYVNSALILDKLPAMKELRSSLTAHQNILKKDGEAKMTAFQQKAQSAEQKKARGEMTPKEEETVTAELQKMQEELYAYSQNAEKEIAKKQEDGMKPILEKVNEAIQAVAKEGGFQYIFDAQSGVILYADESADVTNLVKAKLGIVDEK